MSGGRRVVATAKINGGAIVIVLIADDNKEIRSALGLVLRELWPGCEVVEAGSCDEALAGLLATPEPDLVLLDWDLDGHGGRKLAAAAREKVPRCPVIAMSGLPEHREESLAAGAAHFVGTSDPPALLLDLLRRLGDQE